MISAESISYKHLKVSMFLFSTWLAQHPKNVSWNTQSFWHWGKHASSCSWLEKEMWTCSQAVSNYRARTYSSVFLSFFHLHIERPRFAIFTHQIMAHGLVFWSSANTSCNLTQPQVWRLKDEKTCPSSPPEPSSTGGNYTSYINYIGIILT